MINKARKSRNKYIGSTDVSAIVGICKYKNALKVFNEKLGLEETKQNQAMRMGLLLEPLLIKLAEEELNIKVKETQVFAQHPVYEFLGGTADGVTECGALLEIKTTRHGTDFTREEVPDNYMIQIQWLMGLLNLPKAYMFVLVGGQEFKTYTIYFDQKLYEKLVSICVDFWHKNILMFNPPEIEKKISKELPTDTYILYQRIKELQDKISEQNKLLDELKLQFNELTKDKPEVYHNSKMLAKRTVSVRENLDKKELEKVIDLTPFITKKEYVTLRFL